MQFTFAHNNFNVLNLEKSLSLYREALHLTEARRNETPDESFILVFLGDGRTQHQLELTWLKDRQAPYNLGDNSSRENAFQALQEKILTFISNGTKFKAESILCLPLDKPGCPVHMKKKFS